jgi:hypothetical protein
MVSPDRVRTLALELPEAVEQDHHGRPSFRVGGKIFATLPDPDHLNVMLDVDGILATAEHPSGACSTLHWGKRLAGVQVDLAQATVPLVAALLRDAWNHKAPKRLRTASKNQPV